MKERVLILAPRGRDAAIAADLLSRNAIRADVCADLPALVAALDEAAGVAMLTEEVLATVGAGALTDWVARQPAWSDVPFIVLANGSRAPRTAAASARLAELGNVVLLERPLHAEAMLGAVRSAVKARNRQYEVRDAAVTLEKAVVDRTAELEAARDSLEIALDAAGMGSWDIDLVTGETRRTQRHDEIFGYANALDSWGVDAFLGHVDPAQRSDVEKAFDAAVKTGVLDVECAITAADGRQRCIVAKGRVRYDAAAHPCA
jgi:PAS domain-containing protein